MKGLLMRLPPFAPDYSGVNAAFGQLGGVTIIGGADGCIGNITGYDDPRFFEGNKIFSSGLRNIRAITGDEVSVKEKILDLGINEDIPFILILKSPTSAVIASDYRGLSKVLKKENNVPVISIATTGMDTYEKGLEKALLDLAVNFIKPYQGIKEGVNIIGCTPLDYWGKDQYIQIKKAIETRGLKVNSFWSMEGGIEEIERTLAGKVNLVVSSAGIKAAEFLEKQYNMPYVVGVPVGKIYGDKIARNLHGNIKNEEKQVRRTSLKDNNLIVGEQVWANSFREYLREEHNYSNVKVASFFEMNKEHKEEEDVFLESERDLSQIIEEYHPDRLIGDPFFESFLAKKTREIDFIAVPHLAVSSRLHWNHKLLYVGDEINVIKNQIV